MTGPTPIDANPLQTASSPLTFGAASCLAVMRSQWEMTMQLTTAWTYDMGVPASGYTITPIVINNVMYLPVQGTIIVALQADSGKELWKFDLKDLKGIAPNPSAGGRGIF